MVIVCSTMKSRLLLLLLCWVLALPIWAGSVSLFDGKTVRSKDIAIEELPASPKPSGSKAGPTPTSPDAAAKGPAPRIAKKLPPQKIIPPFAGRRFSLAKDDVVVFNGSENM